MNTEPTKTTRPVKPLSASLRQHARKMRAAREALPRVSTEEAYAQARRLRAWDWTNEEESG